MFPRAEDPSYGVFVAEQLASLRAVGITADLYYIEGFRGRGEYLRALRALKRRRHDYDLFHAHHTFAALAALLAGTRPLIITVHEGAVTTRAGYRRFARAVAARADRGVAVSPAIARALAPVACDVIPIGVDLSLFRPRDRRACRAELGLAAERTYVLFPADPGRPEKRFDLAERAVEHARRRAPTLELIALPPSPRPDVATYFGAADVALVTSDFESGPLTVKEAVASARPVVSRRVGDVDFLDKCDACIPVADDDASIADGILAALALPAVDGAAVKDYDVAAVAGRLAALYRSTVNASPPKP